MNADRAISAFEDILAVEYDEDSGVMRIVTISDCYTAVPEEGMHLCPDQEYRDVDLCKHVIAAEITRGRIDAPTGWVVTDNLESRETDEPESAPKLVTDGGENTTEPVDEADREILRAMRSEFVENQIEREPEHYRGVSDPGCTRRQFERIVLG